MKLDFQKFQINKETSKKPDLDYLADLVHKEELTYLGLQELTYKKVKR